MARFQRLLSGSIQVSKSLNASSNTGNWNWNPDLSLYREMPDEPGGSADNDFYKEIFLILSLLYPAFIGYSVIHTP